MDFPAPLTETEHARIERGNDDYSRGDVEEAVMEGDVIESYGDTGRGPSFLLMHWITGTGRPVHVVAAPKVDHTVIVTVYDPSEEPERWNRDYTKRR